MLCWEQMVTYFCILGDLFHHVKFYTKNPFRKDKFTPVYQIRWWMFGNNHWRRMLSSCVILSHFWLFSPTVGEKIKILKIQKKKKAQEYKFRLVYVRCFVKYRLLLTYHILFWAIFDPLLFIRWQNQDFQKI